MIFELLMTSTVLILVIFFLRKLTMGKISMRLRYALWLLVAVRLLVPASFGTSVFSVMNLLPQTVRENAQPLSAVGGNWRSTPAADGRDLAFGGETERLSYDGQNTDAESADEQTWAKTGIMPGAAAGENVSEKSAAAAETGEVPGDGSTAERNGTGSEPAVFSMYGILRVIWLLGFLTVGGYMIVSEWRFIRYLYKNRIALPEEKMPQEFAWRLSRRGMRVYQVKGLPSPCLAGRHIYIGEGNTVQEQSLMHILAHEYCHARHGDGIWAFLRCALAAVYWFDPFVWAAAYAARKDSELACDEAAVELLGETSRFAYGRTLLALLESGSGKEKCPGMTFMTEGGERSVRERILALAKKDRTKRPVLAAVLVSVVLVCGCAFTGADQESANLAKEAGEQDAAGTDGSGQGEKVSTAASDGRNRQTVIEDDNAEFGRIQKEYEENVKNAELTEEQIEELEKSALREAADQAAFEETLNYHGVMEGKDDGELSLNREVDYQTYYEYTRGEAENPMTDGWYRICRNEEAGISLYGLYTEKFGFRGVKTLIGEDVNTFDMKWCASLANGLEGNIRVLEQAQDGLPRRFAWKLPVEESGTVEIWRLYNGFRYDTGTVEAKTLSEETCLSWAQENLAFDVDREAAKVYVTCDGDMYLGAIDISAYQDWETEDVQIVTDVVSFVLDDEMGEDTYGEKAEGLAVHLVVGLKLKGVEGLWFDVLPVLTIQAVENEDSASGFLLEYPRIDETYVARAIWQERKLSDLRDGTASAQTGSQEGAGQNDLEKPLLNDAEGHHDLEITFCNPCPDFTRISDGYGERTHPVTGEVRTHTGVDLAAPEGADILAAADGTVFMTGFDTVNGNYVAIWHGQSGQMTYYAHCKTVEVQKGQQVAQGERIAAVGKTGTATGPVLHFAISSGSNWEEPYWKETGE